MPLQWHSQLWQDWEEGCQKIRLGVWNLPCLTLCRYHSFWVRMAVTLRSATCYIKGQSWALFPSWFITMRQVLLLWVTMILTSPNQLCQRTIGSGLGWQLFWCLLHDCVVSEDNLKHFPSGFMTTCQVLVFWVTVILTLPNRLHQRTVGFGLGWQLSRHLPHSCIVSKDNLKHILHIGWHQ